MLSNKIAAALRYTRWNTFIATAKLAKGLSYLISNRIDKLNNNNDNSEHTDFVLVPRSKASIHIRFENLELKLNDKVLLTGVSGEFHPGKVYAVMGPR